MTNFFVALFNVCMCWVLSCFCGLLLVYSIFPTSNSPVTLTECLIYVAIGWVVFNQVGLEDSQKYFNVIMLILYVFALLFI